MATVSESKKKKKKAKKESSANKTVRKFDTRKLRSLKKEIKSPSKDVHAKILRTTLKALVTELLPTAILAYRDDPKGPTAYPVTNIVAEVRSTIAQIESTINVDEITLAVSEAVALALKNLVNDVVSQLLGTRRSIPTKIYNSAAGKEMELIINKVIKDFEKSMAEAVEVINNRIYSSVRSVTMGKGTLGNTRTRR